MFFNMLAIRSIDHVFFLIIFLFFNPQELVSKSWETQKGEHFIIHYTPATESSWALSVLRKAEYFYEKITPRIGYVRYNRFWTWEDRLKIFIYPDKMSFTQKTGYPPWTKGIAIRDRDLVNSRVIVAYQQEEDFLDGVLPHEISHFILRDFIGFDVEIPLWFEEGIAQLQEKDKVYHAEHFMKKIVEDDQHIPILDFIQLDIRGELDSIKVSLFYAQSISIIDFLIKKYGSHKFGDLCQYIKEGKVFEDALRRAYSNIIDSSSELEDKWIRYMRSIDL